MSSADDIISRAWVKLYNAPEHAERERLKARVIELEAMTVRLCDIAKVYMTQEAWLRFDADVQRSVFGR